MLFLKMHTVLQLRSPQFSGPGFLIFSSIGGNMLYINPTSGCYPTCQRSHSGHLNLSATCPCLFKTVQNHLYYQN